MWRCVRQWVVSWWVGRQVLRHLDKSSSLSTMMLLAARTECDHVGRQIDRRRVKFAFRNMPIAPHSRLKLRRAIKS